MITNERQYLITKKEAERFRKSLHEFNEEGAVKAGMHPRLARAHREQMLSEIENLTSQILEYERLKSGETEQFNATSLSELPTILVKARIARNWTQKDLAERLGLKEQQIQRYEAELYNSASLKTLQRVAETLDLHIEEIGWLPERIEGIAGQLPINEMYKRGWFEDFPGTLREAKENAETLIAKFFFSAGLGEPAPSYHRKLIRSRGTLNQVSLYAWEARVCTLAKRLTLPRHFTKNRLTHEWFSELAALSRFSDGPRQAVDWLAETGIKFVAEPHLPQTHLDGAAIIGDDGDPIVALTLRYDRLDNFWFVLFHELAHVTLHLTQDPARRFFDDLDVEAIEVEPESEADQFALDHLISPENWDTSLARFVLSNAAVINEAKKLRIHPAIIAGRIRRERENYLILNDFVGTGEVRPHFFNTT